MPECAFTHLHVHSEFSLLSGVPRIGELVARAKSLGMNALALTDRNRMSGLILFYDACRAAGIKPILGIELDEPSRSAAALNQGAETVVLLARNAEGYGDLCELATRRMKDADTFAFARALS